MASGSTLHLLSALQFDNIQRTNISFVSDYAGASVDAGLSLANIILFPEVHTLFGKSKPVIVNTYAYVNKVTTQTYNFNVAFTLPVSAEDVIVSALNFYMVVGDANVTNRREVHLAWNMSIATDISQNSRRGYADASMNRDELIWNAQLSQDFLKGNAATVSIQFYDILRNQSNISRVISAAMRSDTEYNAIYSYCMVHFIYRLNLFGGKGAGPRMGGPGRGPGFGPGPGHGPRRF
jgi:LruC domain-containing protein